MTRQRWPFFQASRNAGEVSTVSARALIEEKPTLTSFAHHGTKPQRICCRTRLPSWLRTATSIGSVGHTFQETGIFGACQADAGAGSSSHQEAPRSPNRHQCSRRAGRRSGGWEGFTTDKGRTKCRNADTDGCRNELAEKG